MVSRVSCCGLMIACSLSVLLPSPVRAGDKPSLETLWRDYQAFGLPSPPADAKLALLPSRSTYNGHQDQHLVLLLRPATAKQGALYWAGCDEGLIWRQIEFLTVAPDAAAVGKTAPLPFEGDRGRFRTYPDLALAVQCYARGWKPLAEALLNRSRQAPPRDPFRRPPPRPRDDHAALAELAWNHFCNQFAWSKGDRKPIVAKLKKLLAGPHGLDTKANRNIVADMERTLVAVKTSAGSPEAALEGLLDFDDESGTWLGSGWREFPGWRRYRNDAIRNPHYKRLRELGASAVPLLMLHRDDFRLTRRIEVTSRGEYTWHLRIADVVGQLLNDWADEPFAYDFLERDGRGVCLDRAHVNAWWKKRGADTDLEFLLKNVESKPTDAGRELNSAILQALGEHFPEQLVKLVERKMNEGDETLSQLVEPLAESRVAASTKERLLLTLAGGKDQRARCKTLQHLVRVKHKEAAALIIAALEQIPRTPCKPYAETQTKQFADVAIRSGNEKVWEALAKTARHVDVGQRMELLSAVGSHWREENDPRLLPYLKSFLDDKQVRDRNSNKLYDGACAGREHERITVGDYAVERLGALLNLEDTSAWKNADQPNRRRQVLDMMAWHEKVRSEKSKETK
jgi:hypothetical protein